jgi:hypothetical protein
VKLFREGMRRKEGEVWVGMGYKIMEIQRMNACEIEQVYNE